MGPCIFTKTNQITQLVDSEQAQYLSCQIVATSLAGSALSRKASLNLIWIVTTSNIMHSPLTMKLIINSGLVDGIHAYAEGQAQLHRDLAIRFQGMWANFRGGGAIFVLTEDQEDEIQQPEMEADGDEEVSDEEEEEGVAVEQDWEFIAEDLVV